MRHWVIHKSVRCMISTVKKDSKVGWLAVVALGFMTRQIYLACSLVEAWVMVGLGNVEATTRSSVNQKISFMNCHWPCRSCTRVRPNEFVLHDIACVDCVMEPAWRQMRRKVSVPPVVDVVWAYTSSRPSRVFCNRYRRPVSGVVELASMFVRVTFAMSAVANVWWMRKKN